LPISQLSGYNGDHELKMFGLIDQISNWLVNAIGENGILAVFLGGITEQVVIPIPSPLIAMASGFLLVAKDLPLGEALGQIFFKITLPYTVAAVLGLGIIYFIAYFGGKPLIEKFNRYLGFSWPDIENLQKKFKGTWKDGLLVFALRAIPVIPISIISGVAGAIRMPIVTFYLSSTLGILVRSSILGFIGWQMGDAYQSMVQGLDKVSNIITVIIAVLIVGVLFWAYKRRDKFLKGKETTNQKKAA
jgi:membrane protein DedA with SNARE-associated domain